MILHPVPDATEIVDGALYAHQVAGPKPPHLPRTEDHRSMTSEPDPSVPTPGGADPLDDTQPLDVPRFAPAPDPRPDTRWAWASPEQKPPSGASAAAPSAWAAPASSATATWDATSPDRSGAGVATSFATDAASRLDTPAWVSPVSQTPTERRSGVGVGTVAVVALLAAVIGSSGTAIALSASGAFNAPAAIGPGAASPATGGTTTNGTTAGANDDATAVITSSAKISPSVVKITTSSTTTTDPFSGGQTDGVGSGIIYDASGWIITNRHVVSGADTLKVETKDGKTYQGTVYGIDTLTDLAIVKVDATGLAAASLGSSDTLKVGQLVVAVGSPLGTYSFSVTSGIVSGKGRDIQTSTGATISNLIQTDAAINAGNAGGPLADASGNVVGINTTNADNSEGIGFAIPIDIAKPIMSQAVKGEKLERPYIGIRYEMITPTVKADQKLAVDNGALVINESSTSGGAIASNSPAAAAGLKDGDILTAINGITIDEEHPLNLLLVQFAPKDTVSLTVLRGGQTLTIPLTLGVRPANLK